MIALQSRVDRFLADSAYVPSPGAPLALKAVQNIFSALSHLLLFPLQLAAHPLQFPCRVIKQLAQPETWIRLGATTLGSALGYSTLTLTAPGALPLLAATALTALGTALRPRSFSLINEELLTGLYLGLFCGALQQLSRALRQHNLHSAYQSELKALNQHLAQEQAADFVAMNNLPAYNDIRYTPDTLRISWDRAKHNAYFPPIDGATLYLGEAVVKTFPSPFGPLHTFKQVIGYRLPLKGWAPPPLPPPLPLTNLFPTRVLPAAALTTKIDA